MGFITTRQNLLYHYYPRWLFLTILIVIVPIASTNAAEAELIHHNKLFSVYPVQEYWFNATIDHFNFRPTTSPTFPLRYYVNEDHYEAGGPVFFYAGNEADIMQFVNNTGFMFESAVDFKAAVVFAEHRYYGLSNPFGNEYALGRGYNISFLSVEQAMQDFNTLNLHIRKKWNVTINGSSSLSAPFIVFGGSYGGNLALWLRLKHPNLWAGAIASSATPLKHLLRETNSFTRIETEAYANVSAQCPHLIRQGWDDLLEKAKTESGKEQIAKELNLCERDNIHPKRIHSWISNALETMVQYGYPYPTNFFTPLPGYPFQVACKKMLERQTGLGALHAAAAVYYNYTGQAGQCFDSGEIVKESNKYWTRHGRHQLLENNINLTSEEKTDRAWEYQTCTEVYQPMPTNGITDFELPYQPNQTLYFEYCRQTWDVVPRSDWEEMYFFGNDIGSGSNIFLTNGQLDPWRAAGITSLPKHANPSIVTRMIEKGAHHFDLRASHPLDPPSVTRVRQEEKEHITAWIREWKEKHDVADESNIQVSI